MSDKEGDGDVGQDKVFWRNASKQPLPIHLHPNLGKAVLKSLAQKIKDHGGDPKVDEDTAEVIICREEGPAFTVLTKKYDHERYKWVEAPSWVDYCIKEKRYDHPIRPPLLKPNTGGRTQYTPVDDNHIVEFLAKRIPYRDMKGRSGQKVWKDLCERADLYPWAVKHSWQSWRERYVKNSKIFDDKIETYVSSDPDPPVRGGKGQYRVDHGKRGPRNRPRFDDIECVVEEEGEEIDIEKGLQSRRKRAAKKPAGGASPSKRRRVAPKVDVAEEEDDDEKEQEEEEEEEEEHDRATVIPIVKQSQPGPSKDVSARMVQPNTRKASAPPLFLPEESAHPEDEPPRAISPTVSEANNRLSKSRLSQKPSSRRSKNALTTINNASRVSSVAAASVNQPSRMESDYAPPASRTRSRSRQPSVEPSAQQPTQPTTRTRRVSRATASPVPPQAPPPTLASQEPQTIDLKQYQVRKRDPTRPVLRPALIPIPELPEGSQPRLSSVNKSRKETRGELPAWETLQATAGERGDEEEDGRSESENSDDGDDGDRYYDYDNHDDAVSDSEMSGMSDMIQLNEGIKALTEQTMKNYTQKDNMAATTTRVARKMPHTSPPPLNHDQSSDEDYYEKDENDEGESENDVDEDQEDAQMTGAESLNTQTSVPAVGTNARKYVISRTPFTPARGTLAQERVLSEQTTSGRLLRERKVDKGKGRAW